MSLDQAIAEQRSIDSSDSESQSWGCVTGMQASDLFKAFARTSTKVPKVDVKHESTVGEKSLEGGKDGCQDSTTKDKDAGVMKALETPSMNTGRSPAAKVKKPLFSDLEMCVLKNTESHLKYRKALFYGWHHRVLRRRFESQRVWILRHVAIPERREQDCWIYPGMSHVSSNNISTSVRFRHGRETMTLSVNFGFINMLLMGLLTRRAKRGIVEYAWHASHLCGNWRCVNARHIVAEAGSTNISRNRCFHGRGGWCRHSPQCLTHLTRGQGGLDGLVNAS